MLTSIRYVFFIPKEVLADSLIKFDEGYGTTVNDSSGTSSGTITGATWKTEDLCFAEKCLFFDGSDWISFGDEASYDFAAATDFTVQFWFRHGPATATEVIVQKFETVGADGGYRIQMESDGDISFGVEDANDNFVDDNITSTAATYDDNNWHFVSAVKDGTTGIYLYIDGNLIVSDTTIGSTGDLTNNDTFYIGDSNGADGGDEYIGFLDEVKVYTTSARTITEIKADLTGSTPNRGTTASFGPTQKQLSDGLVGYWKMDDNTGTAAIDSSGNSSTATLTNSPTWGAGKYGTGVVFDGLNDYVTRADTDIFDFAATDNFTISSWFKRTPLTNQIVGINHETNDLSQYSTTVTDSGDLSVSSAAALAGTGYGLSAVIDDNTAIYGEKTVTTNTSGTVRWRFYFDPNTITMSDSDSFDLYFVYNSGGTVVATSNFGYNTVGGWAIRPGIKNDASAWTYATPTYFTDAPHYVEMKLQRASSNVASDGSISWWLDGVAQTSVTGIDNYDMFNDFGKVRFGAPFGIDAGTSGTVYLDELLVNTDGTLIGPAQNVIASKVEAAGADGGYQIRMEADGDITFGIDDDNTAFPEDSVTSTAATYDDGNWHQVTATKNGVSDLSLFIDGLFIGHDTSLSSTGTLANNDALNFGMDGDSLAQNWVGSLDETRIYNRPLSPSEISQLYASAPGPVAHWKMDENTGTAAYDSSGYGNNSNSFSGTTWAIGKFGSALTFDGNNDRINISESPSIDLGATTDSYTLSAWINTSLNSSANAAIVTKDITGSGAYPYLLYLDSSEYACFQISDGTQSPSVCGSTALNNGVWHHIAGKRDTVSDTINIYVDGVQVNFATDTTTATVQNDTGAAIGNGGALAAAYDFGGQIDDLKIYNYARNAQQIIEDMNAGHPAPGSPVGSYVARWKMDDGTGVTANDTTTNNHDLTLSAASWTPTGKFTGAWNGDGAKWLARTDDSDFDFAASQDLSISLWAKSDSASLPGTSEVLLNKHVATNNPGYRLSFNTSGQVVCEIDDDTSSFPEDTASSATNYYDTAWHQFTCVRDITGDNLNLYVDGKFVDDDGNLDATGDLSNTDNLSIGDEDESDDGDEFFGNIDEVKIFRSALTENQVKADFNFGSTQSMGKVDDQTNKGFGGSTPVGWWKIDEGTGTTSTSDYSGSINDLTMNNFESTDWAEHQRFAHQSYALTFDGSNESLSRTDDPDFDFGVGDFTISAWIKHNGAIATSEDYIITKADTTTGGYKLYMDPTGDLCFAVDDDASWTPDVSACTSGVDYDDNAWHYVVGAHNNTQGLIYLYIDGKMVINPSAAVGNISNTNSLYVGMDRDGTTGGWDGQIDDVKIFNYFLNEAEVAYHFNSSAPFAWYKFDECSNTIANNSAPAINGGDSILDGTITIGSGGSENTIGDCTTSSTAWGNAATGKFNSAIDLDGTDDYVDIGDLDAFEILDQGAFTIEAWFNRDTFNTFDVIASKDDDITSTTLDGWSLYIHSNDIMTFQVNDGVNAHIVVGNVTGQLITSAGWNHVVLTFVSDTSFLYLNGRFVIAGSGAFSTNTDSSASVRIGSESDGGNPFDGKIDNVKMYHSYFSADQVKTLYNEGRAVRFGPVQGSP